MANPKPADSGAPESALVLAKEIPKLSPRVKVFDSVSGAKLPRPVPRSWLTQFPNLKEVPSSKVGK